ncbi:MAG: hypothetical protein LBI28_13385 [Treponema sp.]|jgi:hypothetical protein|nr:hypothetical protein [Treponema sp.]
MKIICPTCSHEIEKENINAEKDYVFCNMCQNAFKISDLLDTAGHNENETILAEKIIKNPPKGAWKYKDFNKLIIGATTRSLTALFLVPFMIVWSGGSIGGIYIMQMITGEFNLFLSLCGIPFLIGSIFLLATTLMTVVGKVEIVIGDDSYVFTGVGKIGIKKRFDWKSVVRIYEDKNTVTGFFSNNRYSSSIYLEGKTRIRFGNGLKEEHKYFLLTALRYYHNIRNYGR